MADLTANSGTTFISDGGSVGVQINTNTNWRFYLVDDYGEPEWLRINGNTNEIVGSESQTVIVEAIKNSAPASRCASGICESISEPGLTAWTGFYQGEGYSSDDGLRLTYKLKMKSASSRTVHIRKLVVQMPTGASIFEWNLAPTSSSIISVYPNQITTLTLEMKMGYSTSYIQMLDANDYVINIVGGNHCTIEPGTYNCSIGFGYDEVPYDATSVNGVHVVDQGNGSFIFCPSDVWGDDFIYVG